VNTGRSMRTAVAGAAALLAIVSCSDAPTSPAPRAAAPTVPPMPIPQSQHSPGVLSGAAADSAIRLTAAAWKAQGKPELARYVNDNAPWSRTALDALVAASNVSRSISPGAASKPAATLTQADFLTAAVLGSQTEPFASGTSGSISSVVTYYGSRAHTDVRFWANDRNGRTVIPNQTYANEAMGDHAWACIDGIMNTLGAGACASPNTNQTFIGNIDLRDPCGVTLAASGSHRVWWFVPMPWFSMTAQFYFQWFSWGDASGINSEHTTTNGRCRTDDDNSGSCDSNDTRLIYDEYSDTPDDNSGCGSSDNDDGCSYQYIYIDVSYDNGVTWREVWEGYAWLC
jgi:hypothetical protein